MKLQNMTVIFSIIVIPITLILSAYIGIQIDTAMLAQQYDTKLMDATHDAIAAFELNTINNKYSTNADSIRRDIKAAINTFSTSLSTGFGMSGSSSNFIMPYIPALVFTLYDGYYIYSPHQYYYEDSEGTKTGYEHILKPYIQYIARYKEGNGDITVNYSLDNYITIYGYLKSGEYVSYSGYLIDTSKLSVTDGTVVGYKLEDGNTITIDEDNAKKYYQEAYDFTTWVKDNLSGIVTPENAVRSDGKYYKDVYEGFKSNTKILIIDSDNNPDDRASVFTQHKREIMKISIQDNLNNAIAAYNEHSSSMGTQADFKMPILTDDDWEKILTNVNMISFMEGIPVGTKTYNNYAIVTSTQNKQYVNPNSIYFVVSGEQNGDYHRINCPVLIEKVNGNSSLSVVGYKAIDFRRMKDTSKNTYYYKHSEYACYTCIVNSLNEQMNIADLPEVLQKSYYSALARERYDLDKITKMLKYTKTSN